ncbi:unnamed protein product, partial [Iphiclides podalirius]
MRRAKVTNLFHNNEATEKKSERRWKKNTAAQLIRRSEAPLYHGTALSDVSLRCRWLSRAKRFFAKQHLSGKLLVEYTYFIRSICVQTFPDKNTP